jgi:hypothetical protein
MRAIDWMTIACLVGIAAGQAVPVFKSPHAASLQLLSKCTLPQPGVAAGSTDTEPAAHAPEVPLASSPSMICPFVALDLCSTVDEEEATSRRAGLLPTVPSSVQHIALAFLHRQPDYLPPNGLLLLEHLAIYEVWHISNQGTQVRACVLQMPGADAAP